MGRDNKYYSKSLHEQAYDRLVAMQSFGESKRKEKKEGSITDKIYSFNTYKTYMKHTNYFIKYVNEHYPEITTLDKCRPIISEWLKFRESQNLSAWTIQTEAKALGKLFSITPEDEDYYHPPQRHRVDVKRSRGPAKRDIHFSEVNNYDLVSFCKCTGLRREEVMHVKAGDLTTKQDLLNEIDYLKSQPMTVSIANRLNVLEDTNHFDAKYYIHVKSGKGGRERYAPIVGEDADKVVERIKSIPASKKIFEYVSKNADIHSYRAEYATKMYKDNAREISEIPYDKVNKGTGNKYQSGVYTCRKDESKKKLDKDAMVKCSKALGHNRPEIVAGSYIRGL
ncbi:MAG: hypothetical protein Q4F12_04640 [Erysipelotrichaceae bacterium]|nr:hypothetical protein [Erysipelotrichaceae bacterium]